MKKLVLFDIDHTLMEVYDTHKKVFATAFKKVYGLDVDYTKWKYHGYTDLEIIHDILDKNNVSKDKIPEIISTMIEDFKKEDLSESVLLPGVLEILERLKSHDEIIVGIVTGNVEEIAFTKLRHFNIHEFFLAGGYGHSSTIRAELIDLAKDKARKFGEIKETIVIGDTFKDIQAAKEAKVKIIAVATGSKSYEELKEKNPDYVFHNLEETDEIVEVILNE